MNPFGWTIWVFIALAVAGAASFLYGVFANSASFVGGGALAIAIVAGVFLWLLSGVDFSK